MLQKKISKCRRQIDEPEVSLKAVAMLHSSNTSVNVDLPQAIKLDLNKKLDPSKRLFRHSILMPKGSEKLDMKILPCGK